MAGAANSLQGGYVGVIPRNAIERGLLLTGVAPTSAAAYTSPDGKYQRLVTGGAPVAASVTIPMTYITSGNAGAEAMTLANPTQTTGRHYKVFVLTTLGGVDTVTITPASMLTFTSVALNAVGEYALLVWNGSAWRVAGTNGVLA